jgi:DNA uptake protein ComE-like DNA-binding protein
MTPPKQRHSESESSWLLDEPPDKAKRQRKSSAGTPESVGDETSQWLTVRSPDPKRNSSGSEADGSPGPERTAPPKASEGRRGRARRRFNPRERRLEAKLRRAQKEAGAKQAQIAEMHERIEVLEAERSAGDEPKQQPRKRTEEARKRASNPPAANSRRKSTLNALNDASFEQLRAMGLSANQSARLIAYRETRGGFDSIDQLEGIPGLSRQALIDLKEWLRA